jgi:hypothetical protein
MKRATVAAMKILRTRPSRLDFLLRVIDSLRSRFRGLLAWG